MTPDPVTLADAAASAISLLCATLDDCAREVQERGGQRVARSSLSSDQSAALSALRALARSLPSSALAGQAAEELGQMSEACALGFARPWMALRVVAIAAEVVQ